MKKNCKRTIISKSFFEFRKSLFRTMIGCKLFTKKNSFEVQGLNVMSTSTISEKQLINFSHNVHYKLYYEFVKIILRENNLLRKANRGSNGGILRQLLYPPTERQHLEQS